MEQKVERKQGVSIARMVFWEVVETTGASGKMEHIVIDTSPRLRGGLPVRVFGPDSKPACLEWATVEAQLYLVLKGVLIGGDGW